MTCYQCGLTFDTLEGYQRHEYQKHGGKIWPKAKGWLQRQRQKIALSEDACYIDMHASR